MSTSVKQGSVVVGVDGSPQSEAALAWAVGYAATRRRPLVLLHGAGEPVYLAHSAPVEARRLLRMQARRVTDRALGTAKRLAAELRIELAIEVSAPLRDARDALLDGSARASMVVVGTRGRGPVRALLLGSVSLAVAEHASCAVAVVRPADRDAGDDAHVMVGTDGGPASTAALELAFELASVEERALDVVHSWSPYDDFVDPVDYSQRQRLIDEQERVLGESLAGYAEKYPDVTVHRHLPEGAAAQTLVAMSSDAAVVVIGSRGRTGPTALMGSVSRVVVERAHSTVVVVRP